MKPNEIKEFFSLNVCNYLVMRKGINTARKFEFGFAEYNSETVCINFLPEADIEVGDVLLIPNQYEVHVVKTELQTYGADEIPYQIKVYCKVKYQISEAEKNSTTLNIWDDRPVYKVSSLDHPQNLLAETDPIDSIKKCVFMILATPRGTVPMYREFGISWDALEYPLPVARAMMVAEIKPAIERWETRASLVGLVFEEDPQNPDRPATTVWIVVNEDS